MGGLKYRCSVSLLNKSLSLTHTHPSRLNHYHVSCPLSLTHRNHAHRTCDSTYKFTFESLPRLSPSTAPLQDDFALSRVHAHSLSLIGVNTHAYTHFHFSFKEKRRENNMPTPSSHRHSLVTAPLRVRPPPLLPLLRPRSCHSAHVPISPTPYRPVHDRRRAQTASTRPPCTGRYAFQRNCKCYHKCKSVEAVWMKRLSTQLLWRWVHATATDFPQAMQLSGSP